MTERIKLQGHKMLSPQEFSFLLAGALAGTLSPMDQTKLAMEAQYLRIALSRISLEEIHGAAK